MPKREKSRTGSSKRGRTTVLEQIAEQLREQGVDLEKITCDTASAGKVKVVCVAPTMRESVEELGRSPRDQVVMVRLDEPTARKLDAWVETGALRSRSQAAALFIQEGLAVRDSELAVLGEAISGVERAKERLRAKAREVLGTEETDE